MPSWVNVTTSGTAPIWEYPIWVNIPNNITTGTSSNYIWYPGTANTITTSSTTTTSNFFYCNFYQDWGNIVDAQTYSRLAQQRALAYPVRIRERTEAENRRLEEEQRQREEHAAGQALARRQADAKAKELLLAHLTPEQRATFERNGWFVVKGGKTGNRYRIDGGGYAGNIHAFNDDGKLTARLCCHTRHDIPLHDHHVAQMLALQFDEERFLMTANRTAVG